RERRDPRTQLKQLIAAWPEISEDLAMLPRMLHRAVRKMDADAAAEQRKHSAAGAHRGGDRRRATRLEQLVLGGMLLIAGVLWTGLGSPTWLGWAGAAVGLAVLAFAPRR